MKRLYRSTGEKQLAGVCGGMGEYFDIDPTLIRVGFVLATILSGIVPGIIAYFVLALVIPSKEEDRKNGKKNSKA